MASKVTTQIVIDAKNNSRDAFDQVNKQIDKMNGGLSRVSSAFTSAFSTGVIAGAVKGYLSITSHAAELSSRVRLVTKDQEEFNLVQSRLVEVSRRTYKSIDATSEMFIKSAKPLRELKFSTQDVVDVTEVMNLGLVASAANADKTSRVIEQFGRGLQAGTIQGDAFNALLEDAPVLLDALQDGLHVSRDKLLQMASAGQLTSKVVIPALLSQMDPLRKKVEEMSTTSADAGVRLEEATNRIVVSFDKLTHASTDTITKLLAVADGLDKIATADRRLEGGFQLSEELAKLTPAGRVLELVGAFDLLDKSLKDAAQGAASTSTVTDQRVAAAVSVLEQEKLLEKEGGDLTIRRLANEEIAAQKLKGIKVDEVGVVTAWSRQYGSTYEEFITREQARHMLREAGEKAAARKIQNARETAIANLRTSLSKQFVELDKANQLYAQIVAQRESILAPFTEAIKSPKRPSQEPNYNDASDLKVKARHALDNRDYEMAIKQAQEALEIIQQLEEAGGNTYGLQGFKKELLEIATGAQSLREAGAASGVSEIQQSIEQLVKQLDTVKKVPIELGVDDASEAALVARITKLSAEIAAQLVFQVQLMPPTTDPRAYTSTGDTPPPAPPPVPGYAVGTENAPPGMAWVGERGPELVQFKGGERVHTAAASRAIAQAMAGVSLPGISQSLIDTATGVPGASPGRDLGTVRLDVGGGQPIQLLAEREGFEQILARKARQYGRTKR
ncbi:tape measure protein [Pseudomonas sp. RIT-PI-AD]|uniref:tape measure protein n=1 Tax=Pseudomonas sp. RIT-PI-AD TaxID=3035294 RepID=UPI0021D92472|nr:tape measure protein [Pseudomonas sp. RIT-PI-AD]